MNIEGFWVITTSCGSDLWVRGKFGTGGGFFGEY